MANSTPQSDPKFAEFLDTLKQTNKVEMASSAIRTKYTIEMATKDNDKREEQLDGINETLKKILVSLGGQKTESLADKDEEPKQISLKEELKSFVAKSKSIGSQVSTIAKQPLRAAAVLSKKAMRSAERTVKDIVSTPKDYDPFEEKQKEPDVEAQPAEPPVSAKEAIKATKPESINPEADNIQSPQEKISDSLAEISNYARGTFETGEESLRELRKISEALATQPKASVEPRGEKTKPSIVEDQEGGGSGILDMFGNKMGKGGGAAGKAGKAGGKAGGKLGSKMLGGAKSLMGKVPGGVLKGGALGIVGAGGEMAGEALKEAGYEKAGGAVSALGTTAQYAGMGAMIGSVVPGVGTAIGGAVGGVIGAGVGLYKNFSSIFGGDKKEDGPVAQEVTTKDISMAKFGENDPEGFQEFQKYREDRYRQILEENKDKLEGDPRLAASFKRRASRQAEEEAIEKFKDRMAKAGAYSESKEVVPRQTGGPMTAGKPYLVGEEGPEVVVPEKAAKVMPTESKTIDLGGGEMKKMNPDGSYETRGAYGTRKYSKSGQLLSEVSPRFAGYQRETMAGGGVEESYSQGAFNVKGKDMSMQVGQFMLEKSGENASIRDTAGMMNGGQPVVISNTSSNNQTTYVPMKADPRPSHRGSALENYNNRIASY